MPKPTSDEVLGRAVKRGIPVSQAHLELNDEWAIEQIDSVCIGELHDVGVLLKYVLSRVMGMSRSR